MIVTHVGAGYVLAFDIGDAAPNFLALNTEDIARHSLIVKIRPRQLDGQAA